MEFERLLEMCRRIAKHNGIKLPNKGWLRRTNGQLPKLDELVETCSEICLSYQNWYQIIRLGTGIRLPMEFLDAEQTRLLFHDATQVARASSIPAYLLLRTYDVHHANAAIREMLEIDKQTFDNWIPNLNILLGMTQRDNLLFELVSKKPSEHERMIQMNISWFMRSNEVFFTYRRPLLEPVIQCLQQQAWTSKKIPSFIKPQAYSLECYVKRMDDIVASLKSNEQARACIDEFQSIHDTPSVHRSREPFVLHTRNRARIYLKPIDAFLDSKEFFPVLIFYQVMRFQKPLDLD
jgi:hypothetical protein